MLGYLSDLRTEVKGLTNSVEMLSQTSKQLDLGQSHRFRPSKAAIEDFNAVVKQTQENDIEDGNSTESETETPIAANQISNKQAVGENA